MPKHSCCKTCQQLSACALTVTILETQPEKEGNVKLTSNIEYSFKHVPSPVLCHQGIRFQKAVGLGKELAVGAYDDVATGKFLPFEKKF